jgi:predicted secreted protein
MPVGGRGQHDEHQRNPTGTYESAPRGNEATVTY